MQTTDLRTAKDLLEKKRKQLRGEQDLKARRTLKDEAGRCENQVRQCEALITHTKAQISAQQAAKRRLKELESHLDNHTRDLRIFSSQLTVEQTTLSNTIDSRERKKIQDRIKEHQRKVRVAKESISELKTFIQQLKKEHGL